MYIRKKKTPFQRDISAKRAVIAMKKPISQSSIRRKANNFVNRLNKTSLAVVLKGINPNAQGKQAQINKAKLLQHIQGFEVQLKRSSAGMALSKIQIYNPRTRSKILKVVMSRISPEEQVTKFFEILGPSTAELFVKTAGDIAGKLTNEIYSVMQEKKKKVLLN